MRVMNFSFLKSEEVQAFSFRLLPILEPLMEGDEFLSGINPKLRRSNDNLAKALTLVRTSEYTVFLFNSDALRDQYYIGFKYHVASFLFHPDEEKVQAAKLIDTQIQASGPTLYNLGYAEETAQLNGLLSSLQTPEAQAAIKLIGADFWLDLLIKAQQAFEELYQQKVAKKSTKDLPPAMASRKEIVHYLSQILNYLDAKTEANPEKYNPVVEKIDEIIVDMMTVARSRKSRKNNNKEEVPKQ
jgi:hypothetical protein